MISATIIEKAMLYEKYRLPYAEEMVGDLRGRKWTILKTNNQQQHRV